MDEIKDATVTGDSKANSEWLSRPYIFIIAIAGVLVAVGLYFILRSPSPPPRPPIKEEAKKTTTTTKEEPKAAQAPASKKSIPKKKNIKKSESKAKKCKDEFPETKYSSMEDCEDFGTLEGDNWVIEMDKGEKCTPKCKGVGFKTNEIKCQSDGNFRNGSGKCIEEDNIDFTPSMMQLIGNNKYQIEVKETDGLNTGLTLTFSGTPEGMVSADGQSYLPFNCHDYDVLSLDDGMNLITGLSSTDYLSQNNLLLGVDDINIPCDLIITNCSDETCGVEDDGASTKNCICQYKENILDTCDPTLPIYADAMTC